VQREPHVTQQEIDFENPRGQQRQATKRGQERGDVRDIEIPRPSGGGTSPATCKAILCLLDEHVRSNDAWRLKLDTIAAECNCSVRTVSRALAWLTDLGLVVTERTGRSSWFMLNRDAIHSLREGKMSNQNGHRVQSDRSPCPIRMDTVSNQNGHRVQSDRSPCPITSLKDSLKEPPPPSQAHASEEEEGISWEEVWQRLADSGVNAIGSAIAGAQTLGYSPEAVCELIAAFAARDETNPGVLYFRLVEGRWPDSSAAEPTRQAAARRQATAAAYGEQTVRSEREQIDRELELLEQRHGQELDRLTGAELQALVESVYATPAERQYCAYFRRRGSPHERLTPEVRCLLLAALAQQDTQEQPI